MKILKAAATSAVLILLTSAGCSRENPLPAEDPSKLTIQLHSPAFANGRVIPKQFTCDGSDGSPPLEWSGVPEGARALALICDDPDAPMGTWSHWVLFNLSPRVKVLKEAVPTDETLTPTAIGSPESSGQETPTARQGKNDFGKIGYGGPCPPSGIHRYFFRLYALDQPLELGPRADRGTVLKAIQGHILAEGRLMGKYSRAR
jgi:Raf kinase inhibitor-like YbhB/YbcL family protein